MDMYNIWFTPCIISLHIHTCLPTYMHIIIHTYNISIYIYSIHTYICIHIQNMKLYDMCLLICTNPIIHLHVYIYTYRQIARQLCRHRCTCARQSASTTVFAGAVALRGPHGIPQQFTPLRCMASERCHQCQIDH